MKRNRHAVAWVVAVCVVLAEQVSSFAQSGPNNAPIANTGGPYAILNDHNLYLDGSGSSDPDPGDAITEYSWDLNDDGTFGDVTGVTPVVTPGQITGPGGGPGTYTIRLRVTDSLGGTGTASIPVTIYSSIPVLNQPSITLYGRASGGELYYPPNSLYPAVRPIFTPLFDAKDVTLEAQAASPLVYNGSVLNGSYVDTVALRASQLRLQAVAPTFFYHAYQDAFGNLGELRLESGAQAFVWYYRDSITIYGAFPANTSVPFIIRARVHGVLQPGPANQGVGGKIGYDFNPGDQDSPRDVQAGAWAHVSFASSASLPNTDHRATVPGGPPQTFDVTFDYLYTSVALVTGQTPPAMYHGGAVNTIVDNGASADITVNFDIILPRGYSYSSLLGSKMRVVHANAQPSFTDAGDVTAPNSGPEVIPSWATDINPGAPDEADQTLTFVVTGNSNPYLFAAGPEISLDGTLTFTATPGMVGTALITVVLRDDGGTVLNGVDTSTPHTFLITVNGVDTAATVTSVQAESPYEVVVKWSEPVTAPSATTTDNYALDGGLSVSVATLVNPTTVRLLTSRQEESTTYSLHIQGVEDTTGNPSQLNAAFRSLQHVSGQVRLRTWRDDAGVFSAFGSAGVADRSPMLDQTRSSYFSGEGLGDTYFGQLRGWFTPETTGNYVFFCASDDESELYLATDDNPATKQRIASVPGWTSQREWQKYPQQRSATVHLEADRRYYLELVWREGLGGDHGAVAVIREGESAPVNGAGELDGSRIGNFIDSPIVVPRFTLNLPSGPVLGGAIQASPEPGADGKYDEGTVITLTAVPAAGFAFVNWSGGVSSAEPSVQITLNADADVTANFRALSAGILQFTESYLSVTEAGAVQFTVSRIGGSDGPVSVDYQLGAGGSAVEGEDFTFTAGNLSWEDGEMGAKSFAVEIIDDALVEFEETVLLELINPTGGASLAEPATAAVSITDNEPMIVNVAPSFLDTGEVRVRVNDLNPEVIIPGWAYGISAGAPEEAGQNLRFVITWESGVLNVSPQISPDGTLTFTRPPNGATGFAQFAVVLQDDGGTAFGGSDTSGIHYLEIVIYRPNIPPVANPGGPYEIDVTNPNAALVLDGRGSYDPEQALGRDGGIVSYSWDLNGDGVFGDATGPTPTLTAAKIRALNLDSGRQTIALEVTDTSSASVAASTTVAVSPYDAADTIPPVVTRVQAESPWEVVVHWNEPLTPFSAGDLGSYFLDGANDVVQATLVNPTTVRLTTREMTEGRSYSLSIQRVRDFGGNPSRIEATFRVPRFVPDYTQTRIWNQSIENFDTLDEFLSQRGAYLPADREELKMSFTSAPALADHYYGQLRSWFVPTFTQYYIFACSSDDDSRLYLTEYGADGTSNRRQIAFLPGWTNPLQWDKYDDQTSEPIYLQAGKKYCLELFWREIGGNDHAAVWVGTVDQEPLNGALNSPGRPGMVGIYVDSTDSTEPQVISIRGESLQEIVIRWSEPLNPSSASEVGNYLLSGSEGFVPVRAAMLVNPTTVVLTTTYPISENVLYSLRIQGVRDLVGNSLHVNTTFRSPRFIAGLVRLRAWNHAFGNDGDFERQAIAYLPPDREEFKTSFFSGEDLSDHYWGQMRAWFIPFPSHQSLHFFSSADDFARLYLHQPFYLDESHVVYDRQQIALVPGWTRPLEWNKYSEQHSLRSLLYGQRNGLELVWRDETLGDHGAVAAAPEGVELFNGEGVLTNGQYGILGTYVTDEDVLPRFNLNLLSYPSVGGSIQADPPPDADGKYEAGTVVTLTAAAASGGFAFVNFSSQGKLLNSGQITISADVTITANFSRPPEANAGPDQTLHVGADCTATLQLDGSASSDLDDETLSYNWDVIGDQGYSRIGIGAVQSFVVPPGNYRVQLTVLTFVDGQIGDITMDEALITVLAAHPTLTVIDPVAANAGGPDFILTANGGCFDANSTVLWNGSPRPTTIINPGQLTAIISATDLNTTELITSALVTVRNGNGQVSGPLPFTIKAASVGIVDASVLIPGGTDSVSTAPTADGNPGVAVAVQNNGGELITMTAATYSTEPVGATAFRIDDGSYVDVQINGADSSDTAAALFYYPSTVTGTEEENLQLHYRSGTAWIPVESSRVLSPGELSATPVPPVKDTTDNRDSTISGGRFAVIFDDTSKPKINELGGTVFGMFDGTPQIRTVTGPNDPVALGTEVTVALEYAALGDPAAVRITFVWDDGTEMTVGPAAEGIAGAVKLYTVPGVYGLTILVTDENEDIAETRFEYVVVYDPNGGFVTGGGWIQSPPGAYLADPTLTGKANFGFTSKYKKGASVPTGNTEFQFKAGDLNFSSTAYQWLVLAGARAQYKGIGTINGAGNYGFLLTATDGDATNGGGVDRFRIKIWDRNNGGALIYDNAVGAPEDLDTANPQGIGGGSIVVHSSKK